METEQTETAHFKMLKSWEKLQQAPSAIPPFFSLFTAVQPHLIWDTAELVSHQSQSTQDSYIGGYKPLRFS